MINVEITINVTKMNKELSMNKLIRNIDTNTNKFQVITFNLSNNYNKYHLLH